MSEPQYQIQNSKKVQGVGYQKRGTLSKNQKNCLDLANIKAKGQPRGLGRFSDSPEARAAKASDEKPTLRFAEAPSPEALPILRFARGWLGNNLVASVSTDFSDKTSRPINASNHSCNVSRTSTQYSRVADGTGVTSAPCSLGQDGAGVTGHRARHCAHD